MKRITRAPPKVVEVLYIRSLLESALKVHARGFPANSGSYERWHMDCTYWRAAHEYWMPSGIRGHYEKRL